MAGAVSATGVAGDGSQFERQVVSIALVHHVHAPPRTVRFCISAQVFTPRPWP
jgi:hypothetical protein